MESTGLLIDQLHARITELEAENARLRAELAALSPPQPVADKPEATPDISAFAVTASSHAPYDDDLRSLARRPQPVAGWRETCVVEKCGDGWWDVVSPCGDAWLCNNHFWHAYGGRVQRQVSGSFTSEASARAALAACPTPPPGVTP